MKEVKLHLGCGNKNFGQDWIHIDGGDFKHLHSRNICILPFKDKTVDLIYASHVLEYFDRDEVFCWSGRESSRKEGFLDYRCLTLMFYLGCISLVLRLSKLQDLFTEDGI